MFLKNQNNDADNLDEAFCLSAHVQYMCTNTKLFIMHIGDAIVISQKLFILGKTNDSILGICNGWKQVSTLRKIRWGF